MSESLGHSSVILSPVRAIREIFVMANSLADEAVDVAEWKYPADTEFVRGRGTLPPATAQSDTLTFFHELIEQRFMKSKSTHESGRKLQTVAPNTGINRARYEKHGFLVSEGNVCIFSLIHMSCVDMAGMPIYAEKLIVNLPPRESPRHTEFVQMQGRVGMRPLSISILSPEIKAVHATFEQLVQKLPV